MLTVEIKKRMGDFTLDVSFSADVETMALLGASGSGKSMTLKCIAGIETPDSGRIVLDNQVLYDSAKKINLPPRKRKIGYLFQNYALFPNMTVEENIAIAIREPKERRERLVRNHIRSFLLEGLEKKKPHQLSGGQQQRVALARIIASDPCIIMLDEPFAALDSYLRWQLEQEILDVIEAYPKTVLYVSHNRDEVYRVCDRIGVIQHGKIDVVKEKKKLFDNPETLSAALLTGCKNYSRMIRLEDNRIKALDWQVELITQNPVSEKIAYVGIRAHHIQIMNAANGKVNCMECKVVKVIDNNFTVIIMVVNARDKDITHRNQIRLEMNKEEWQRVQANRIWIRLRQEDVLLLK